MFSMRSVRQLCDAKLEKLLGHVFYMRSVSKCYKQDKLVVRQSPASTNVNTVVEGSTMLEAVTRQQPVQIQQTEKI
jgi:hypothetical protein